MSEPTPPTDVPDSLQTIRNDLQRRESDAVDAVVRLERRQHLSGRLGALLLDVVPFAKGLWAPAQHPRTDNFFADLARSLLNFNEALRNADKEYPRYRILERLRRAANAGIPALDTAASLLLYEPGGNAEALAQDLERIQGSRPHDEWSMWFTYVFDQLLNSQNPPAQNNVPPNTTRVEWRKAELAFGCVLFSDEVFSVLQDLMDKAVSQVDVALKSGGHPKSNLPIGRVRNLISQMDSRALRWYGSESLPGQLLQPPPAIEAITEPTSLRRQLDEVWTAANALKIALDKWSAWFVELQEKGDAHPAVALSCKEMAGRAVHVLVTHRPTVEPFDRTDEAALWAMLPPIPTWWMPGIDVRLNPETGEMLEAPRVEWQRDQEIQDQFYWPPECRQEKAMKLRGAAAQLIELLKSYPMTALAPRQSTARPEENSSSSHAIEVNSAPRQLISGRDTLAPSQSTPIFDSLFSEAASRRRQEDEARRVAEENARRRQEHADRREHLVLLLNHASAFPNEENEQGRKPCSEGFRRWAERFVAIGNAMRECESLIKNLQLREPLRTVNSSNAPPAMKFACALLLEAAEGSAETLTKALERAHGDEEMSQFASWLGFILDRLWHPYSPGNRPYPIIMSPIGTSWSEHQQAESAFRLPSGLPALAGDAGVPQLYRPASTCHEEADPQTGSKEAAEDTIEADEHREIEESDDLAVPPTPVQVGGSTPAVEFPDSGERPIAVRWSIWALGVDSVKREWRLFRKVGVTWQRQDRTVKVSVGQQEDLLKAFAEGGGFLTRHDAIAQCCKLPSVLDKGYFKRIVVPAVSRVRDFIRDTLGVKDSTLDPLPYMKKERGFRALIEIGYVVDDDSDYPGGDTFSCFKTKGQLSGGRSH